MEEVGCCLETGKVYVKVDPKYFRPTEVVSQISPFGFVCTVLFKTCSAQDVVSQLSVNDSVDY